MDVTRTVSSFHIGMDAEQLVISSPMKVDPYPSVLHGSQHGTLGPIKQQHVARHLTVITTHMEVSATHLVPDGSRHGTLVKQQYGVRHLSVITTH